MAVVVLFLGEGYVHDKFKLVLTTVRARTTRDLWPPVTWKNVLAKALVSVAFLSMDPCDKSPLSTCGSITGDWLRAHQSPIPQLKQ